MRCILFGIATLWYCRGYRAGTDSGHSTIPFQGGLRSQIAIRFKATDKLIIRIEHSEDWRAIGLLHLRATEASGVGLGFDGRFGDNEFTTTSAILAAVDLALGH